MIEEDFWDCPDEWDLKKFENIADTVSGKSFDSSNFVDEYKDEYTPVIRIRDIHNNTTESYTNEEFDDKYEVDKGDLLVGMDGNFESSFWNGEKAALNQRVLKIESKGDIDIKLIKYWLDIVLPVIHYKVPKTTVKHLSVNKHLNPSIIPVPPLDEQERIVSVVEARLERVKRLEKSVENIGRLADEYQDSTRKSLLFGGSVDLGQNMVLDNISADNLPKKWDIYSFEDVIEFQSGYAFESSDYVQESKDSVLCFRSGDYNTSGEYKPESEKKYLPRNFIDKYPKYKLDEGDIIMTMVGANCGKMYMIGKEELPALLNQNMWRIRTSDDLTDNYCYNYMKTIEEKIKFTEKGAARQYLTQKDIKEIKIPVPPLSQQEEIIEALERIDSGILQKSVSDVDKLFSEYRASVLAHAFQGDNL